MIADTESKLIKIGSILEEIYGDNLHQKRQQSIGYAALGVLASDSLFIHRMAEGLVKTRGVSKKHATKQLDRLLSNKGICIWSLSASWVPYVLRNQQQVTVALDWTSFYDDSQSMLCLNWVTSKGLSTPLLWKSVDKTQLKHNRARFEDQLLSRFKDVLPPGVEVTLLADRGFAAQTFFRFLTEELQFNYIIRIKSSTTIISGEKKAKACDWLRADGRLFSLTNPGVTLTAYEVAQFVAMKDKGMKAAWFLVSNMNLKAREMVNLYSKRWKIEPYFRDLKDARYGWGLKQTHVKSCERRDKLMLILALSYTLLIILGEAGELLGFDKKLKVNTVKTRTHSLFRQGQFYYEFFFRFTQQEQQALMDKFSQLLQQHPFWPNILGHEK